jgi:hypothetical protein
VSHYDVLGVAPAADDATLRRAYVALARRHHPDLAGGDPARMRAVNEAWATLGDPDRRARYDQSLTTVHQHQSNAPAAPPDPIDAEDDAEDDCDLYDARPVRVTVRLPRWLGLVPVALFAGAVGTFVGALLFVSEVLLSLAAVELVLSCLFFLASPFIALFAARTGAGGDRSQQ